jgi:hypothetical protein
MSQLNATDATHLTPNNAKATTVTKRATGSYVKEPKNAKALTQVGNWLKAAAIQARPSSTPGCDLTVKTADGRDLEIKVALGPSDERPAAEHLFVLASELAHRTKAVAVRAFHSITEAAGHGRPLPINRGVDPAKKLSFEDNFELVAMRHKEFRKVPNPTAEELKAFDKVIGKAVSRFLYINTKICRRHGLEFDDLKTYAQIWTCNYLGLYKVANPTNNDNERKLYAHLCQRFGNFVEVLLKKERSCIPDPQTTSVALLGRPYNGPSFSGTGRRLFQQEQGLDEGVEFEAEPEHEEPAIDPDVYTDEQTAADEEEKEQTVTDAKRRKLAQGLLRAEFSKLDHETLTYLLTEASENPALCPDARSEAKKQLRLHKASCGSCPKPQEEAAGAQALG